jgi:hypothetical protein
MRTLIAIFSHNIICMKLKCVLHACIHVYDCHIGMVCLCVCNISCLDCEEELNYKCDYCECAGCFQGK